MDIEKIIKISRKSQDVHAAMFLELLGKFPEDILRLIETIDTFNTLAGRYEVDVGSLIGQSIKIDRERAKKIWSLTKQGHKVEAIKDLRLATNLGLKEAKDIVNNFYDLVKEYGIE